MKQFSDFKVNREQSMCGFRSERDMFWASFAIILLPVIMGLIKFYG